MLTSNDDKTEAPVKATSIQLDHCYTGSSNAGNAESEETESEEEEIVQRTRGRGKVAFWSKKCKDLDLIKNFISRQEVREAVKQFLAQAGPNQPHRRHER
jgi:hypothetical protein